MEAMDSHGPASWFSMLFLCQKWGWFSSWQSGSLWFVLTGFDTSTWLTWRCRQKCPKNRRKLKKRPLGEWSPFHGDTFFGLGKSTLAATGLAQDLGMVHHASCRWSDWDWLVLWNMFFSIQLGMSSSQHIPTDFHSIIFQRGRSTTNQICWSTCCATQGFFGIWPISASKIVMWWYQSPGVPLWRRFFKMADRSKIPV